MWTLKVVCRKHLKFQVRTRNVSFLLPSCTPSFKHSLHYKGTRREMCWMNEWMTISPSTAFSGCLWAPWGQGEGSYDGYPSVAGVLVLTPINTVEEWGVSQLEISSQEENYWVLTWVRGRACQQHSPRDEPLWINHWWEGELLCLEQNFPQWGCLAGPARGAAMGVKYSTLGSRCLCEAHSRY